MEEKKRVENEYMKLESVMEKMTAEIEMGLTESKLKEREMDIKK